MSIFCSLSLGLFGQDLQHEYIGSLIMEDQSIISHKINFREIGDGKIIGESISYFSGINSTTPSITGGLDRKKNLISFKETKKIRTY
jgi:hypothetical protein